MPDPVDLHPQPDTRLRSLVCPCGCYSYTLDSDGAIRCTNCDLPYDNSEAVRYDFAFRSTDRAAAMAYYSTMSPPRDQSEFTLRRTLKLAETAEVIAVLQTEGKATIWTRTPDNDVTHRYRRWVAGCFNLLLGVLDSNLAKRYPDGEPEEPADDPQSS